jgi:hypothetical protein
MDAMTVEITLKVHPSEMRDRLDRAASIAVAALDVEQLVHEVNTLLNSASLIHRYKT